LLASTTDPLGIFLRGFVLVEGALNDCFREFLARPLNLFDDLDLYISGKIKLGHALGFLTGEEKTFLSALNRQRNQLVHENEGAARTPRHIFDAEQERSLWTLFRAVPSMSGGLPVYDAAAFPDSLKTMLVTTWLFLNRRSVDLKNARLVPLDDTLRINRLEGEIFSALATMLVRITPSVAQAIRSQGSLSATGPNEETAAGPS
jgi:hypothetical protein